MTDERVAAEKALVDAAVAAEGVLSYLLRSKTIQGEIHVRALQHLLDAIVRVKKTTAR